MTIENSSVSTIRAGAISVLVPTVCYLWLTGLGDSTRLWLFMVSFAVCFVLMMQAIVELLIVAFALFARISGAGMGCLVRAARRRFAHSRGAA